VCRRGSLEDVLDRVYQTAREFSPEHIVRLTGDCPLVDPEILDAVVLFHVTHGFDYCSNALVPMFPDGLDTEAMTFRALETAWRDAALPSERQHVTPYFGRHPELFFNGSYRGSEDLSGLRWTVDEPEDLEFVRRVFAILHPANPAFGMRDVLGLLQREPALLEINSRFERNEGMKKSLIEDRLVHSCSDSRKISQCMAMQDRARRRIPGMTQLLSKRPDQFSGGVWPGYFQKARGVEVWDLDGNRYIDMSIGGIGANVLGYADPDVDEGVRGAIANGTSCSLNCTEEVELADLLCELHPWADQVRYARTGGESMAMAVRIARAATGRDVVAFCGYHGWHDWYLAANLGAGDVLGGHLLQGLNPAGVPRVLAGTAFPFRYNHVAELEAIAARCGRNLAAIVMEPIRSEAPAPGFLEEVREIATRTGAVFIFDEISSGFRLNSGGAHLLFGVPPDVAVFSKAMGNGYPIAAVIGRGVVMEAAQKTFLSSTYWTERIGPTAALATIRKHRQHQTGTHLVRIGQLVQKGWKDLAEKHGVGIEVRGIPPLSHFSYTGHEPQAIKALFVQLMLDRGYLASTSFYAMGAHTDEHVEGYLCAADSVFAELAGAQHNGTVMARLRGRPASAGFTRLA
jgi:glutamate-1-semialdehyde 2,1-aminomutase